MQAPASVQWISDVLRTLPGPTDAWAEIVGHLAWPTVVVFLVFRFRRYLRIVLNTIADRLVTDHVKLGPFELTPNSEVIVLDGTEPDADSPYSGDDLDNIERLFEFIGAKDGLDKLDGWIAANLNDRPSVVEMLTTPSYSEARVQAVRALIQEA